MLKKIKVLIVDDEPIFLISLKKQIQSLLYEFNTTILTAKDGREALRIFDTEFSSEYPCNLVITDYNMPRMNGLQLADHIRVKSKCTIILHTTVPRNELPKKTGVTAFIEKGSDSVKAIMSAINVYFIHRKKL